MATQRSKNQERKSSPKRKFLGRTSRGHPGVIRADVPAQNFGQGGQNLGKQAFWRGHPWPEGADVHDPKGFPKTSVRKTLGWIFVPPRRVLRRFWEGFWARVLRSGLAMVFTVEKGSEKGSQKGFWEGGESRRFLGRPLEECAPLGVRPLFTGVFRAPGRKVTHGVLLGPWLGVPQRALFWGYKSAKKHSKSALWGTPSQGPKSTQEALRGALSGPGP